ncbi:multiheme c-type cytochrome [Acidicapsa acidisoli]|uniref:multiheme c-type cytochrome n=1 Tax=Acidicapsa acidisoli TaxID=1615681 RepID=UPI0021DF5160|nr:multiheme c-type cytochrome [Acidicapsa acidisoli]
MANASGPATNGFLPGEFTHSTSGVSYRMVEQDGRVYLKFARAAEAVQPTGSTDNRSLNGQRELKYFLGSGKRGRTYLFEQDGYWFEIPVNWYGKKRIWDMAPNYLEAREMPLTLPVDPGCLRCHTSGAQPSLPQARNRYAGAPFLEGGITCTACHGDAAAHLASGGRTAMMKIEELPAIRRDSICLSCHLEGEEMVVHEGKRLVDFQPGQSIFDYASYFVRQAQPGSQHGSGERATSQWEALLQSGCKRGAGEKLTCATCHDPHGSTAVMSTEERAEFYRTKCLQCHDPGAVSPTGFAAVHHPENRDCVSCHMPRARAEDIAHEQVTDHRIPRVSRSASAKIARQTGDAGEAEGELVAIGTAPGVTGESNGRDLGLAYAFAASRGDRQAGERALQLLREAEALPSAAADAELHEHLGFLDQLAGDKDAAVREYGLALDANAADSIAEGNLALLKAGGRQYGLAVQLWERAFQDDPVQLKAGMNLAIVECGLGRKEDALVTLDRLLAFSPDYGQARGLTHEIRSGHRACGTR